MLSNFNFAAIGTKWKLAYVSHSTLGVWFSPIICQSLYIIQHVLTVLLIREFTRRRFRSSRVRGRKHKISKPKWSPSRMNSVGHQSRYSWTLACFQKNCRQDVLSSDVRRQFQDTNITKSQIYLCSMQCYLVFFGPTLTLLAYILLTACREIFIRAVAVYRKNPLTCTMSLSIVHKRWSFST